MNKEIILCSCIECRQERNVKGIHSHYLISHTIDGHNRSQRNRLLGVQNNVRNNSERKKLEALIRNQEKKDEYISNPNYCAECNKIIVYGNRGADRKFCDKSCAAKYNNRNHSIESRNSQKLSIMESVVDRGLLPPYSVVTFGQCKKCNEYIRKLHGGQKYCDACRSRTRYRTPEAKEYRKNAKFSFSVEDEPQLFNDMLIEKYGWYKPAKSKSPNLNGLVWDHLFRVIDGLLYKVSPEFINHPANARLMPQQYNQSIGNKSSITKEELFDRIRNWKTLRLNNTLVISTYSKLLE